MKEEITLQKLSQEYADSFMKNLSGEPLDNFKTAFHEEKENMYKQYASWALPPSKRIYYLLLFDGIRYLLVGINPNAADDIINISSFEKVATEQKDKAAVCMKKLIECKLIPMCHVSGKKVISALITTDPGRKVFENLKKDLPKGVKKIDLNYKDYISWSCVVHLMPETC